MKSCGLHRGVRVIVCLSLLLVALPSTFGTVILPDYNKTFASVPALFGNPFPQEGTVSAYLQFIEDWPRLCGEEGRLRDPADVVAPPEDVPVALLVKRGECTFWEKGKVAAGWENVAYVVIYDNEDDNQLVAMSSELDLEMSLMFVSYNTGIYLIDLIDASRNGTGTDAFYGILIEMDAVAPMLTPPQSELNITAYFVAALTGFLAFLLFFGCVILFAQIGLITARRDERGRIIVFTIGRRGSGPEGTHRQVLTEAQVKELEEVEYNKSTETDQSIEEEGEHEPGCAICLDDFEEKEMVIKLPCGHLFHKDCVFPWLTERQACCPLCKFDILEHMSPESKENSSPGLHRQRWRIGRRSHTSETNHEGGSEAQRGANDAAALGDASFASSHDDIESGRVDASMDSSSESDVSSSSSGDVSSSSRNDVLNEESNEEKGSEVIETESRHDNVEVGEDASIHDTNSP